MFIVGSDENEQEHEKQVSAIAPPRGNMWSVEQQGALSLSLSVNETGLTSRGCDQSRGSPRNFSAIALQISFSVLSPRASVTSFSRRGRSWSPTDRLPANRQLYPLEREMSSSLASCVGN